MPPPPPADGAGGGALEADGELLRRWALPVTEGAKAGRGTCLVVGGSALTPGAVVLAAVGALRSGAGKVQVATAAGAAPALAVAVPEALVIGLDEDDDGNIVPEAVDDLLHSVDGATSVLVGPGLLAPGSAAELLARVSGRLDDGVLVVDAKALPGLADEPDVLRRLQGRSIVTPNTKELGALTGRDGPVDDDELEELAIELADRLHTVVAAKGADTWVATGDGRRWRVPGGGSGLSTAGSGDVLAGVIAGLAARSDEPAQATVHGVYAHAEAGRRLAERIGRVGFLAREILDEIPRVLDELAR
jgi:ADP-dependent NAD(P)H-hydrate dehydratase